MSKVQPIRIKNMKKDQPYLCRIGTNWFVSDVIESIDDRDFGLYVDDVKRKTAYRLTELHEAYELLIKDEDN